MKMKITVLGSGTSTGVPQIGCNCRVCTSDDKHDKRLRASVLVEMGESTFLIDCGPDFRQQMLQHYTSKLKSILITHGHYDHVGGLDDVRPFGMVQIYAEAEVTNQIRQSMPYCFKTELYPGVPLLTLNSITTATFEIDGIKIVPIRIMHAELPILGFRIGNFAYITDLKSISDDELMKLKGLELLIINALRIQPHISHITIDEAVVFANKIGANKTYFTHFSHDAGLHVEIEKKLTDNIFPAYDGLIIEI